MRTLLLRHTVLALASALTSLTMTNAAFAQRTTSKVAPWPSDASMAGLQAAMAQDPDNKIYEGILPEEVRNRAREYAKEVRSMGLSKRSGVVAINGAPTNVRANNPTGDAIGETQAEIAVAVFGDTVVVGWNDSKGFGAGFTVSSFGYSTNGGATFIDGGNVPLASPSDQAFGDPGLDTDEKGNWYSNQIYTRPGQQNIGVHRGKFIGGTLVWDSPVMASIGTSATGNLDKCLLACDRVTGNVYVAYTRFTAVPRIEIVRSTTKGATWDAPIVLDATTTPTSSKQSARPLCGPNGEVYVVWEKGANTINCPDGLGNVSNSTGVIGFARSLDFGVSYLPFTTIGTVEHSWTWSGPGDLRERANEFPDIAVDRSGGPFNGNVYVTWHESAPWTASLAAGPIRAEAANVANNNPTGAETFLIGENVTGSSSSTADLDYWQFSATQGQSLLFNLDPQGFNCGVSGTTRGMRMRLFATQNPFPNPTGFPDTLLAASALGAFAQRIVWTAPKTGSYLIRIQPSTTAIGTYTLRARNLTFGAPSPARDSRDVVVVRSSDQGATWSSEQLINDDAAGLENRRPFITADGLGHVHAFWHDSRRPGLGSNAALTSIYGTTSRDGGLTWTPNYEVTDELSFFSFNTRAVPNLGDYNQAAATANGTIYAAWSDQRLSTGDVRTPGTNTFTAGLGPEAYTAKMSFGFSVACPSDTTVYATNAFTRTFSITNTGNLPDNYGFAFTDNAGILTGTTSGTTGLLAPGASALVTVTVAPTEAVVDHVTFAVTPVGDVNGTKTCATTVTVFNYVFMARENVKIDMNKLSAGNILSNDKIHFYVGAPGGAVHYGDLISGGDVTIRSRNRINGDVVAGDEIFLFGSAQVTGTTTKKATVPRLVVPPAVFTAGGNNVTVRPGGSKALAPGSYDRVLVDNNATLLLSRGDYYIHTLDTEPGAKLSCNVANGRIHVNVVADLEFDAKVQVAITGGGGRTDMVQFTTLQQHKVDVGRNVTLRGTLIANHAEVHFSSGVKFKGAIFADVVTVEPEVWFSHHNSTLTFPKEEGEAGEQALAAVEVVTDYALEQNYPNPFNPETKIKFALPEASEVKLIIYDMLGNRVKTLVNAARPSGRYEVTWDGRNHLGEHVAGGMYIYRLLMQLENGEPLVLTKKMLFVK